MVAVATIYASVFRRIKWAYVTALGIIATLSAASFLLLVTMVAEQDDSASVINVSGRQRMLSQRIALFASRTVEAATAEERAAARDRLKEASELFERSHQGLIHGDPELNLPGEPSSTVWAMYFAPPLDIERQVRSYLGNVERIIEVQPGDDIASTLEAIVEAAEHDLLFALNAAVDQYEQEARALVARTEVLHGAMLAFTLLMLIGEARFIFRPLAKRIAAQTQDLADSKSRIEHAAMHDSLTDLPNRRHANDFLDRSVAAAATTDSSLGLLHVDLDRFKEINDTLGHQVGDEVLCHVGRILRQAIRPGDLAARIGGDEFVVIVPKLGNPRDLQAIVERIFQALRRPFRFGEHVIGLGASIGVAVYPRDADSASALLANADIALYEAKRGGRNRFSVFAKTMRQDLEARNALDAEITQAIERREFMLHFQPQIAATSGHTVGMEALVRWQHPQHGLLYPDAFLPLAVERGQIVEIGQIVLEMALEAARTWREQGLAFGAVGMNVAAAQLRDGDFKSMVEEALARSDVPPYALKLEILETTFIEQETDDLARAIAALAALGVGIELDDFGTGHTSLAILHEFNVDRIKIDRSFTQRLTSSKRSEKMTATLIDLGKQLDIGTVAEGVETREQIETLGRLGCDYLQGFGIARPMPLAEASEWLRLRGGRPSLEYLHHGVRNDVTASNPRYRGDARKNNSLAG